MRQILPRIQNPVLYATSAESWAVAGAGNPLSSTFGANAALVPLPWNATFRNIALYCQDPSRVTALTQTFRRNTGLTGLTVTLPVGQPYATATTDIACNQLDYVDYRLTGAATGFPGYIAAFSIEHDGPGNFFGLSTGTGSFPVGAGWLGGAFGNGSGQGYPSGARPTFSNTTSICSVPGTVTAIALGDISGLADAGGSWMAFLVKNGIPQDGSGGTVDTRVTLLDSLAGRRIVGTFALPVVPKDFVDVVLVRQTTARAFAVVHVGTGIGFVPDDDGWFMVTGGNNIFVPGSGTVSYGWTGASGQTSEPVGTVPIGPVSVTIRGLYSLHGFLPSGNGPGAGETITDTVLQGTADPYAPGTPTAVTTTIADLDGSGEISGLSVSFPPGSSATIRTTPSAGAFLLNYHWGLALTFAGVGPTPPSTGTLVVVKAIQNSNDTTTTFDILVGGGLSPSTLSLTSGGGHVYPDAPITTGVPDARRRQGSAGVPLPGALFGRSPTPADDHFARTTAAWGYVPGASPGYSVSEPVPPTGWELVSITVSNGSDASNISLAPGETVTVTVLNKPTAASRVAGCPLDLGPGPSSTGESCLVELPNTPDSSGQIGGGSGTAGLMLGASGAGESDFEGGGSAALGLGAGGDGRRNSVGSGNAVAALGATGAGEATQEPTGSGVTGLVLGASGAGTRTSSGTGTAALTLGLQGVGDAATPQPPPPSGFGAPALTLGSSGAGVSVHRGTGTAALVLGGSGAGRRASRGSATVPLTLGLVGVGSIPPAEGPFVTNLSRASANPVLGGVAVSWTLLFNEAVTGVTLGAFTLTGSTASGSALTGLSGSGASYTVTAQLGSTLGTVGLTLTDPTGIRNAALAQLTGTPVVGESYTVEARYVSTTGSDLNPGTFELPWRHVAYGAAQLVAGNTLYVRAGNYAETIENGIASGTSWANPVRIAAYPGEAPWLVSSAEFAVLWLHGPSHPAYIEFDGINVDGATANSAVHFSGNDGNPHHIRFQNAEIIGGYATNSASCLGAGAHILENAEGAFEILNNRIHGGPDTVSYGIYLAAPNSLIENNEIYDVGVSGIHIYNGAGDSPDNNIIRNNRIHDLHLGVFFGTPQPAIWGILVSGANNQIYNNLIYDNASFPYTSERRGITVFSASGTKIWNNTLYGNHADPIGVDSNCSGTEIRNNLAYQNSGVYVDAGVGTVESNNLFDVVDPLFTNAAGHDFTLQAGSPALNAGTPIAEVTVDIRGRVRSATTPTIGAYEGVG